MFKEKYYITTAIPYANANPHIGHAILFLYADVMARYQRLLGKKVFFLTGTDEHGQKMVRSAQKAGRPIEEYAAEKSAIFQNLIDQWNISNNDFIRTTETRHMNSVKKFWSRAIASGDIYKKTYQGLYCVGCESYKTEKDLIDGKCPDHDVEPEELREENYFFRLSKYQEPLQFLFEQNPTFVTPETKFNEMKSVLKNRLEDISVSRSKEKLSWGIPVPNDEDQVMYVWFDALANYITALGWGSADESNFNQFWPADAHVIGKDINRFHSLLWPAMLMSVGIEPPRQIAVHGLIYVNDQKMSKSIGNVIDPLTIINDYPVEAVRYCLLRELQFDNDNNFSLEKFNDDYNADLANGIGNLTYRILTMIEKYGNSVIPDILQSDESFSKYLQTDVWPSYCSAMQNWQFHRAIESTWKFISFCDQTISDRQPWKMAKEGKIMEVNNLLYHLAESLRHIAVMIWPIMPETAEKIFIQLGLDLATELSKPLASLQQWVGLPVGTKISKGEPLFPRIENKI